MVAERHRLRALHVREARHHVGGMRQRLLGEHLLQPGDLADQLVDRVADPEPEIERDLVVARARGVQPPRRRPDEAGEPRLDVHMDIFQRAIEGEVALLDFATDRR